MESCFRIDFKRSFMWIAVFFTLQPFISKAERLFPGNPYSHRLMLDPQGKFLLEWIADPRQPDVVFNLTAETKGYVAIGFSKTGKMTKSDVVLAGVDRGIPYISDRFVRHDKRIPVEDIQQSWKLLQAWENRTHTSVRMSRLKDTCDPQDYVISDNTMHLLWAYGEDDAVDYHFQNRGSLPIHLLQPDLTPQVPSPAAQQNTTSSSKPQPKLDVWRLSVTVNLVPSGASWCVFQRGPEIPTKYSIIGFSTPMTDEKVRKHLDRLVIYKCLPIYGMSSNSQNQSTMENVQEEIERLDEYSGECRNATELFSYCKDIIYTWGMGGKDIFLPGNVGIPFGGSEEYYLLESYLIPPPPSTEVASNNSSSNESVGAKRDSEFNIDTDILLTDTPRKFEAKILKVGYDSMSPLLLPNPISKDFEVFGHCPNECTSKIIPRRKPFRVFGVSFDAGPFGKRVTLHHLRNAFEIPIILHDGNMDPIYQQMHILPLETPVRQSDQITIRCKYKNAMMYGDFSQHSAVNSSLSSVHSRTHRCLAYLWYYQERSNSSSSVQNSSHPIFECTSRIHPGDFARWIDEETPVELRQKGDFTQLLDSLQKLKWSPRLQLSLFELYELARYRSTCGGVLQQQNPVNNGSSNVGRKLNRPINDMKVGNISIASRATDEITVYPLPVEDIPSTIGCPTLDGPLLLGPPGPVIFG